MYDAFRKRISAHEPNHPPNGDESGCGSTHHVPGRIFDIIERKLKAWKPINKLKYP